MRDIVFCNKSYLIRMRKSREPVRLFSPVPTDSQRKKG